MAPWENGLRFNRPNNVAIILDTGPHCKRIFDIVADIELPTIDVDAFFDNMFEAARQAYKSRLCEGYGYLTDFASSAAYGDTLVEINTMAEDQQLKLYNVCLNAAGEMFDFFEEYLKLNQGTDVPYLVSNVTKDTIYLKRI